MEHQGYRNINGMIPYAPYLIPAGILHQGHFGIQPRIMTSQLPHSYVVDHHLILNQHNITSEVNQQVSTIRGATRRWYNADISSAYYIQDGIFILDESISQVNQQVPTRRDNGGRYDAKLERIIIQQVPTDSEAMTCSICLVDFSVGLEAIQLPNPCLHVYHKDCILEWLDRSSTCPMCRRPVVLSAAYCMSMTSTYNLKIWIRSRLEEKRLVASRTCSRIQQEYCNVMLMWWYYWVLLLETSSAQHILLQYIAASGGLKLQNSISNAYAMGKLRMIASKFETAKKVTCNRNSSKAAEYG
ncbi:hypothetical protein TSUD_57840 [Trifolium subterraneum]|uniref:RING-type domain-containing protein n=1 Tax=Trifolium subterraneum TaxID=3900 RepID=A0A2Z6MKR5_TRISU|nr:hypothetical protein TSUD_57840 [Trifolium subterraneum]